MATIYETQKSAYHLVAMTGASAILGWVALIEVRDILAVVARLSAGMPVPADWHWPEQLLILAVCGGGPLMFLNSLLMVRSTVFTDRYVRQRGLFKKRRMYWAEVVSVVEDGASIILQSERDRMRFNFLQFPDSDQLGAIVRRHVAPALISQTAPPGPMPWLATEPAAASSVMPAAGGDGFAKQGGSNPGHSAPRSISDARGPEGKAEIPPTPNHVRGDVSFGFAMRLLGTSIAMLIATNALAALAWRLWHGAPWLGAAEWLIGSSIVILLLLARRYWWRMFTAIVAMAGVMLLMAKR